MSSYGYGYSDYGYESYGFYGYGGSYRSYPNAALYLDGPGSSYYISQPYSNSYAYETQAGGIYRHTTAYTSGGYVNETYYKFSSGNYKLLQTYTYENFEDKSGPAYGYGSTTGYYASYGPPTAYTRNTFSETQSIVSGYTYFDNTGVDTRGATNGYIYSSYTHQTSEAVDGHPIAGAGYAYFLNSVTDPYGYSTYSSHTSTF